ncbi:hypothetical protein BDP67DRAFT_282284 [Colletotrichum lupini]|nr:hypothetical protein BDP67DRAFT_282284 [Colletotrichum lupini]
MASYADPPVQDRWDSHDFDGDPDRYLCLYSMSDEFDLDAWATPDPRVTTMVDMGDAFASEMELHRSTLNPVKFEKTESPFDGGSSDDGGFPLPRLLTFRERRRLPVQLLLRKSRHAPIACGKCREDMIASCSLSSRDKLASVRLSDLATMEDICVLDFVTPVPVSPDDGQTAHLDIPDTCRQVSFGKLNGVMQLLSVAV